MCLQDCPFCPTTIDADTVPEVKERGKEHLRSEHYDEFETRFTEEHSGQRCLDGCGYTYPKSVEEVAGFDCPECGHDHFEPFATRYLYWQIEVE